LILLNVISCRKINKFFSITEKIPQFPLARATHVPAPGRGKK
jgi:hypothetical protein